MATLNVSKVVSALPGTLVANTTYMVRVGTGFDLYTTNNSGTIVAYKLNATSTQGANSLALDGLTGAANTLAYFTGAGAMDVASFTSFGRSLAAVANATDAKTLLTLNNVNNTSDANKPISTATQTALDAKLDAASGVAASATKLATARTINGVAFDGTANITIAASGGSDNTKLPLDGSGVMTGPINEAPQASATAAGTVNISSVAGNTILMSGATAISGFTSAASGQTRRIVFTAATTVVHSANLILPGAATISAAIGDVMEVVSGGSGVWRCFNYMRATGQPVKGGMVAITDALYTTGTNGTVFASGVTSLATSTDADMVITPKGAGAFQTRLADGGASGGNKRGQNSVDMQMVRSSGLQSATGNLCVISGGSGNTAAGTNTVIGGGLSNAVSNTYATISGGSGNTASGSMATVIGGGSGTASGNYSVVLGGLSNTADAAYSVILGGLQGTARGMIGSVVRSNGQLATTGDCQTRMAVLRTNTISGATPVALTADNLAVAANNIFCPANNSVVAFTGTVVARDGAGNSVGWTVSGLVKRLGSASTIAVVGTPTITLIAGDASTSSWTVSVITNTTYGGFTIGVGFVGGVSGTAFAKITCVEHSTPST